MKKKTTKKAAKKPAAKKAAGGKKASAKKGAAKKAAPKKKAAAKKAAPKKAAAKKAAPKKAAPAKKTAPAKKPAREKQQPAIEVAEASAAGGNGVRGEILAMARELYGPELSDDALLALDPNSIDEMDPSIFYEMIQEKFGVESDPDNDYFGGFGGPIHKTIAFVESRWDGQTKKETPAPPSDWLEEYVHPATGGEVAEPDGEDQSQVS